MPNVSAIYIQHIGSICPIDTASEVIMKVKAVKGDFSLILSFAFTRYGFIHRPFSNKVKR